MGIHVISMCAILAIIPLYWLPVLPDLHIVWLLIAAGVALSVQKRKWLRFSGLALLFMCWGILAAQESVWPMNHLTKAPQQAEVVITATDGATMHQGRIPASKCLRGSTLGDDPAAQGGTRRTQRWRL